MTLRSKVIVIAEAGVNHNGSLNMAKKLVDKAVEAKADFIKFQTFNLDQLQPQRPRKLIIKKKIQVKLKLNSKC